jgi:hypothetical protein
MWQHQSYEFHLYFVFRAASRMKHQYIKSIYFYILVFLQFFIIATAHADVATAERNFKKEFVNIPASFKFSESPFEGFYLADGPDGRILFTEDVSISGDLGTWELNEKGKIKPLPAEATLTNLRKRLKTDWMVKMDTSSGDQKVIIISAPDCPVCKTQDNDLRKFGKQLNTDIYIIPTTLAGTHTYDNPFTRAVMCEKNPLQTWNDAMSRNKIAKSNKECALSVWASVVMRHTFAVTKTGKTHFRSPAVIRSDGSVMYGWDQNMDLASVKLKLGIN